MARALRNPRDRLMPAGPKDGSVTTPRLPRGPGISLIEPENDRRGACLTATHSGGVTAPIRVESDKATSSTTTRRAMSYVHRESLAIVLDSLTHALERRGMAAWTDGGRGGDVVWQLPDLADDRGECDRLLARVEQLPASARFVVWAIVQGRSISWTARKLRCSRSTVRRRLAAAADQLSGEPRLCIGCGEPLPPGSTRARSYCTQRCGAATRRRVANGGQSGGVHPI